MVMHVEARCAPPITVYPIKIMRMNHRVVLFLMACNGLSADSIMAPALPTFHFAALSNNYI